MNRNKNESLELLLKESLIVNPVSLQNKFHRTYSSLYNEGVPECKNVVPKKSKSSSKTPNFVKYPLKNIPLGLEEKQKSRRIKKQSSTLDLIEKLKQIDVKTEKADFLEQANEEINIAFLQLQELQKLIARKMTDPSQQEQVEEVKQRRDSLLVACNKQFERMQKKYLNKTRIRYRSLQDFEKLTQNEEKSGSKNVEVLFRQDLPAASSDNFLSQKRPILKKTLQKSEAKTLKFEREKMPYKHVENVLKSLLKPKEFADVYRNKTPVFDKNRNEAETSYFENNIKPLLKFEEFPVKKNEIYSEINKIKYLLKPEHHGNVAKPKKIESSTQVSKRQKFKPQPYKFSEAKLEQSILTQENFQSSSEEQIDSDRDDYIENLRETLEKEEMLISSIEEEIKAEEKQKIDEAVSTDCGEGKNKKVNFLLPEGLDDPDLAESVSKSAYLTKEFTRPGFGKSKKDKAEQINPRVVESVIHKFRDQLQPTQLANLNGRDQKLYTTLNRTLKDTLYREIRK